MHRYQQQLDSTSFNSVTGFRSGRTTRLENIKGRNFYQWQAMIPFGFELNVYRRLVFIKLEGNIGIIGNRFIPKQAFSREAHGAGLWLTYNLR